MDWIADPVGDRLTDEVPLGGDVKLGVAVFGMEPLGPGHELDLDVLELSAGKHSGHHAAACQLGSDTVDERVRIDLCTGHIDSVDDGPGLAVDHPAGNCGGVLVPRVAARPELLPILVHEDVVDMVNQQASNRRTLGWITVPGGSHGLLKLRVTQALHVLDQPRGPRPWRNFLDRSACLLVEVREVYRV